MMRQAHARAHLGCRTRKFDFKSRVKRLDVAVPAQQAVSGQSVTNMWCGSGAGNALNQQALGQRLIPDSV
jgi:hypothetical protein